MTDTKTRANARTLRAGAALGATLLGLAACATEGPDAAALVAGVAPRDFTCCEDPAPMPEPVAYLGKALGPSFSPIVTVAPVRPGLLKRHPEAIAHIEAHVRPLDIVLFSNKNWFAGSNVPGRFTHAVAYLGTEAELRALGVWDAPEVRPHQAAIRAGQTYIESVSKGIHLADLDEVSNGDAVVVVRPRLDATARRAAARRFFGHLGGDFDYVFDLRTCDQLACTELVARVMPELGFPVRDLFGGYAIIPDDVAAQAVRGERLDVVTFAYATWDGWRPGGVPEVMQAIATEWRPAAEGAKNPILMRTSARSFDYCAEGTPLVLGR